MAPLGLPAGPRAWICQIGAHLNKTPKPVVCRERMCQQHGLIRSVRKHLSNPIGR